jgi:hemerythrin
MSIQWSPALEIGIGNIDEQHRHFVGLVNQLLAAMEQGRGGEALAPLAESLVRYAETHFALEEAAMATHRYPDAAVHRALHAEFKARAAALQRDARGGAGGSELVMRYGTLLHEWLGEHIARADKRFGGYLRSVGATAA